MWGLGPHHERVTLEPPSRGGEPPGVRGLFQQRVAGDDALLRLASLRFAQAAMPAELYADTPREAERLLDYLPDHATRPTVHLNRGTNLLDPDSRATILAFVDRLGDRVSGLIVHDKRDMIDRVPDLVEALRVVGDRTQGPHVFMEYAAGAPLDWFADVARRAGSFERAGVCVDTGHVGLAEVRRRLGTTLPPSARVTASDPGLQDVVAEVQAATREALPSVLSLISELGRLGTTVHFHLHDGHPAIPGLSDHFSFLTRVPVPFEVDGARSLTQMFGPAGLAAILHEATSRITPDRLSLTLEIHQAEGRLPLDPEAQKLFAHWRDRTNAERLNYWLSVVTSNHVLATSYLSKLGPRASGGVKQRDERL
jgi:hypothetical protein